MYRVVSALTVFMLLLMLVSTSTATEEYAGQAEKECSACHVDPLGGGRLTEIGQGYLLAVQPSSPATASPERTISGLVRLAARFIHITTAFMWFGTILYVHLVLKPAYASQGLPRGEVRVGLVSMVLMAVTGTVLTYYKVPAINLLLPSRFGILLLAKIAVFIVMVVSALFVVLVIGPKLRKKKEMPTPDLGDLTFDMLRGFDGNDGRPAYIAFRGTVYDVSKSKLWQNGNHMKRHQAGTDLTDMLSQAPHEEDKVLAMPTVGKLSQKGKIKTRNLHEKVFYLMAYMNLAFVFIIGLILALWR